MTAPQILDIEAGQSFFGVRFRPGMAAAFLPEAARLNDKSERLDNLMGATASRLFEQLAESINPIAMVEVMERFLRPLEPPDAAQRALQRLPKNRVTMDRVASESSLSSRQFRRVCLERAGVSPKHLMRILRFRCAAEQIAGFAAATTPPNWAQFAVATGYYDQAHFIREFQEFTGSTPGRYLQSLANRHR
jgi:AraC-like DNA-binding protein